MNKKRRALTDALAALNDRVRQVDAILAEFSTRVAAASEQIVARMIVELETVRAVVPSEREPSGRTMIVIVIVIVCWQGGNLRFEDGQPTDSWWGQ